MPRTLSALGVVGALSWLLAAGLPATARPGFSPDEELTALVVSASPLLGVPVLPSSLAYPRGVLYVKLAGIAAGAVSPELSTYRLLSLLFGLGGVAIVALLARRCNGWTAAPVVAALVATAPLYAAISVFARPYTAAICCLLLACLIVSRAAYDRYAEASFLLLVVLAQLTHEAGALTVLIPLSLFLTMDATAARSRALWLTAKTAVIAGAVQYGLAASFALSVRESLGDAPGPMAVFVLRSIPWPALYIPALASTLVLCGAAVAVTALAAYLRLTLRLAWVELLVGAACAFLFLLGPLLAVTILGVLAQPSRTRAYIAAGMAFAVTSALGWTLHTALVTDAALSPQLAIGIVRTSLSEPFGWVHTLFDFFPLAMAGAVVACLATLYVPRSERRLVVVITWLMLLTFGALRVVAHDRYLALVMPFFLLLASLATKDLGSRVYSMVTFHIGRGVGAGAATLAVISITAALAYEQRTQPRDTGIEVTESRWGGSMFTLRTDFGDPDFQVCAGALPEGDLLVCNDELACRHLFRRVDAWLLPDAGLRQVCAVERAGVWRGIYAGSEVLADGDALAQFIAAHPSRNVTVAVLPTPKFGYSEQYAAALAVADAHSVSEQPCGAGGVLFRFVAADGTLRELPSMRRP